MEVTRSLPSSRRKKPPLPFYEPPARQTSARIIEEARRSVRVLPTERPYTPADSSRNLFGSQGTHSRPPSVYSIGARHFSDDRLSRPPTGQILAPIEKTAAPEIKQLNETPPTPVQSLQDLSNGIPSSRSSEVDPAAIERPQARAAIASHSMVMLGRLGDASTSSLSSTESVELKPKQSATSPVHSKRSHSAGRRISLGGSKRVLSAGDEREKGRKTIDSQEVAPRRQSKQQKALEKQVHVSHKGAKDKIAQQKSSSRVKKSDTFPFWDTEVAPILAELDAATLATDVTDLYRVCDSLWGVLERHDLLGRSGGVGGSRRRAAVLRSVFRLLDRQDPHLLLKLAKIILAMKVTGKNLLNVCKLLFAIAKEEVNDGFFLEECISGLLVDLLLMATLHTDREALVYGLGTIKLLASNSELRNQLGSAGVVQLLANMLQAASETEPSAAHQAHVENVLVQLTASLRNLSDSPSLRPLLTSSSLIPQLSSILSSHMSNADIVFNIARVLSKLTLHNDCRDSVIQCPTFLPLFLQALTVHADNADIVVRVCFILGNLTSEDRPTREQLFFSHSALPILQTIASRYLNAEVKQKRSSKAAKSPASKAEDVMIKLVRLTANLSVHPRVGAAIAGSETTIDHLLQILGVLPISLYEELILNTLATVNNLSYFAGPDSCVAQRQQDIAELLVKIILEESSDGLLECTRVYGNLSRFPRVRSFLSEKKVDEMMVTLLDSGRRELVYSACGVLINLMIDEEHRDTLGRHGGVKKLIDVLHDFGPCDWQLAGLVCKTLWNYSEKLTSASSCFGEEEVEELVQLLETFTSESCLSFPGDLSEEARQRVRESWQENFLPVAQVLLARVCSHHSALLPLDNSCHSNSPVS